MSVRNDKSTQLTQFNTHLLVKYRTKISLQFIEGYESYLCQTSTSRRTFSLRLSRRSDCCKVSEVPDIFHLKLYCM